MTVEEVIEVIRQRRKRHVHPQVGEDGGDPLRWSEGGVHRAILEEYDALLEEIEHKETGAKRRYREPVA